MKLAVVGDVLSPFPPFVAVLPFLLEYAPADVALALLALLCAPCEKMLEAEDDIDPPDAADPYPLALDDLDVVDENEEALESGWAGSWLRVGCARGGDGGACDWE